MGDPEYNEDADFDGDEDVDFDDLNILLAVYDEPCDCYLSGGGGGGAAPQGGGTTPGVALNAASTPATAGPPDTLVCDLSVTGTNGGWTLSGLDAETVGGARFVVSSDLNDTPATIAAGQCYVRTPSVISSVSSLSAGPTIAGAYDPSAPDAAFGTQALNIAWCPTSPTGDGAILHLVMTLPAGVSGSTVYLSANGPQAPSDVLLANVAMAIGTLEAAAPTTVVTGLYLSTD